MMTAKENVIRTLRHDNPEWIPVNLWQLPAAKLKYGQALDDIINRCEIDILSAPFDDPTEDARHYQIYRLLGIDLGKSPSRYYRRSKRISFCRFQ